MLRRRLCRPLPNRGRWRGRQCPIPTEHNTCLYTSCPSAYTAARTPLTMLVLVVRVLSETRPQRTGPTPFRAVATHRCRCGRADIREAGVEIIAMSRNMRRKRRHRRRADFIDTSAGPGFDALQYLLRARPLVRVKAQQPFQELVQTLRQIFSDLHGVVEARPCSNFGTEAVCVFILFVGVGVHIGQFTKAHEIQDLSLIHISEPTRPY